MLLRGIQVTRLEKGTASSSPPEQSAAEAQSAPGPCQSPSWLCPAAFPCLGNEIHSRIPEDDSSPHLGLLQAGAVGSKGGSSAAGGVLAGNPRSPGLPAGTLLPGPVPKRDTPPPSIGKHPGTGSDRYPSVPATPQGLCLVLAWFGGARVPLQGLEGCRAGGQGCLHLLASRSQRWGWQWDTLGIGKAGLVVLALGRLVSPHG